MSKPPVAYGPNVEHPNVGERKTVAELNEAFDVILDRTSKDYAHGVRSVHAKSHGVLEGELYVDAALPPALAQGLFVSPGTHKVLIRKSTNAGNILPDSISLPRGLAMKVFDVAGARLPGAEGTAQDFILVNGKVFGAPTADKFLEKLNLLATTTDRMEGAKKVVSAARAVFAMPLRRSVPKHPPPCNPWVLRQTSSPWAKRITALLHSAMASTSRSSACVRWPPP